MNPNLDLIQAQTRRTFLRSTGQFSLGAIAAQALLRESAQASPSAANPFAPRSPHFAPKAKRVVYLHMSGGPPHLDIFDYKPELVKHDGEPAPDQFVKGKTFAFTSGTPKLMGTPRQFAQYGKGGLWMSDAVPNFHGIADEMCVVKSMFTDQFNHTPAELLLFTGSPRQGRPSLGSWTTYGLGSDNENLPGFVALISSGVQPSGGQSLWGTGFLPSVFQGVQCRSKGDPVLYVSDPAGMDRALRRKTLDALRDLNEEQQRELGHPETATRIAQYELAFKMQTAVPGLVDVANEPQHILDSYGCKPGDGSFASNCLLARRLAERGVRFIQLYHRDWDHHNDLVKFIQGNAANVDRATAALIKDLKQRGLLDDTLIVWGGEFGRTPMAQANKGGPGRDHHMKGFSMFLCGGGVKRGTVYGATDELGYASVENVVHVHDLQATLLHQLGINHQRLTVKFQGLDVRLTGVGEEGRVVKGILA